MTAPILEGGCLCGAVRYRIEAEPQLSEYCHCSMCRKAAGAPVVAWADFPAEAVRFTAGKPAEYASSDKARRGFCAACGSALYFRWLETPDRITLTIATLDDPERVAPTQHIFHADRLSWLELADTLPRHDRYVEER